MMKRKRKTIDELVHIVRNLGEQLMPYNFPSVSPEEEDDINVLKFIEATVDGYDLILHFNKHDYENHFLETFQILGKDVPFVPFAVVCKLARKFLGSTGLSLVEILKDNRKIYCWTVMRDRSGIPIENPYKDTAEEMVYEGFEYKYVSPDRMRFY